MVKEEEIEKIVDYFTEKLYSHQYLIGRKEAKDDLGLKNVVNADETLARAMTELYEAYQQEMGLGIGVWSPENELGLNVSQNKKDYKIANIESVELSNYFNLSIDYKRQQVNMVEQVIWRVVDQGWK